MKRKKRFFYIYAVCSVKYNKLFVMQIIINIVLIENGMSWCLFHSIVTARIQNKAVLSMRPTIFFYTKKNLYETYAYTCRMTV